MRTMTRCWSALSLVGWLVAPRAALADSDSSGDSHPRQANVETSASQGRFLSLTHAATVGPQPAFAAASGGYDGARSAALFEATVEARVWGPIALRGAAVYSPDLKRVRPSFGIRAQVLKEGVHGLDGTIGAFYRPEGLTEAEGEIEAVLASGLHVGRTYLLGNLVYGQDPEGNERDGEVRLGAVRPVLSRLLLGLDGRLRFSLGDVGGRGEPKLDAMVGPVATIPIGPVAVLVQGGGSMVKFATVKVGPFVSAGLGSSF
jgi:hypothetical protein